MRSSRLHHHLLHEHGRDGREINGLPLADLHHFEHVEQAMGLNDLRHQHPEDVGTRLVSAEPMMPRSPKSCRGRRQLPAAIEGLARPCLMPPPRG